MFTSLAVFVVIICSQASEKATGFELDSSNGFYEGALGDVVFSNNNNNAEELGGVQLFARGLENGDDATRELDAEKAISLLAQISPTAAQKTGAALTKLVNNFGDSLVGQLFAHIRYLTQNQNLVKQFPGSRIPSSDAFRQEFTREALLADVENLPVETVANGKKLLSPLVQTYKGREMGLLFSNIADLLDLQPALKRYAQLCESVDEAFGLNKPIDISQLPVPTDSNPVEYFELIDEKITNAKFLVRVKKESGTITTTVLIRVDGINQPGSYNSIIREYTVPDNSESLQKLYGSLPMSRFIKKE